jgi:hypothetical protein
MVKKEGDRAVLKEAHGKNGGFAARSIFVKCAMGGEEGGNGGKSAKFSIVRAVSPTLIYLALMYKITLLRYGHTNSKKWL